MSFRDTFVRIAADCPGSAGVEPPRRGGKKPVHLIQLELLRAAPHHFTHQSLVVESELLREPPTGESRNQIVVRICSKPLPCLRCSPLAKRYGWGFHFDGEGKIAVHAAGSASYEKLAADPKLDQVSAMRSKRA
ncbi:DUF6157 family protein [Luteolibacter arcticus]|uniref:DUF6157 family protein n=1 Tax=Luteolibacter arcticus TaxID=1581411 RepID=A0ABT3GLL0_9BACT|nr:DUF6157 family protein [Luteolibacter arcticus]MCW1924405.1 DUF6157 family protein [Luteolibacter arcticus]